MQLRSPVSLSIHSRKSCIAVGSLLLISQKVVRGLCCQGSWSLEHQIAMRLSSCRVPRQSRWPLVELGQLVYYGRSHALVISSRKDTWALVVNEAMAAGLSASLAELVVVLTILWRMALMDGLLLVMMFKELLDASTVR